MAKFPFGGGRFMPAPTTSQVSHHRPNKAGGPTINRGKGNNNASTPMVFINAVVKKFGLLTIDLACTRANAKAPLGLYHDEDVDALMVPWAKYCMAAISPLAWLNPPFTNITPWARKCAAEVQLGARTLLLVPASVGANWYWDWVVPYADVYSVGRMVFDDCYDKDGKLITTPYPKDLILAHYDWHNGLRTGNRAAHPIEEGRGMLYRWRWQDA